MFSDYWNGSRKRNYAAYKSDYTRLNVDGEATRQYLRGQARTDLPFKLSCYYAGGDRTKSLLTRILTDYDVPAESLTNCANAYALPRFREWVRQTTTPLFWTHLVVPLNSIWVRNESGSFELFLRRLEDKMKDGTWHEAAAGIKSIEVVDDENLNSCRVDNARFLRQMLRFSRALERLTALSVFKWNSELPISLSILKVLAYQPHLTKSHLRIKVDSFLKHSLKHQATIESTTAADVLIPFYRAFEGVPTEPKGGGNRKMGARVEIVLEGADEDSCAAILEWAPMFFIRITTLTVHGPPLPDTNARQDRLNDEEIQNIILPGSVARNLEVEELILSKVSANAAQRITSKIRPQGLRHLVLEWCVDYVHILNPLAHQAKRLRQFEVYAPSAAQYQTAKEKGLQTEDDIFLCDFIRSETFELQILNIFGGIFSGDQTMHNHLFYAVQTHLKSLRQLRVIASDEFDLSELREMGICAPNLFELRIRAATESLIPALTANLHNFTALRGFTLQTTRTAIKPADARKRIRSDIKAIAQAAGATPLKRITYYEQTPQAGFRWSYRIDRPKGMGAKMPCRAECLGLSNWNVPAAGFDRDSVVSKG